MGNPGGLMPSPWTFKKYGQCGMDVSELFPHMAEHVDDIALIRSMYGDQPGARPGAVPDEHRQHPRRPSQRRQLGHLRARQREREPAGLHRVHRPSRRSDQRAAELEQRLSARGLSRARSSATGGTPIVDLKPPADTHAGGAAAVAAMLHELNEKHARHAIRSTRELSARVFSYELAFRMQTHAPEAIDISKEIGGDRKLYGVGEEPTDYFGRQALMARRLVERGVRYVQIFSGGGNFEPSWDAHWDLKGNHGLHCAETDKPLAGLIKDLKSRGMFDDDADRLARRVRTAADLRADGRARSQQQGLQRLAGGRRREGRHGRRRDGSVRLPGRREPEVSVRAARDDPAPARSRLREAHIPLQRPRHAAHRRARQGDPRGSRVA